MTLKNILIGVMPIFLVLTLVSLPETSAQIESSIIVNTDKSSYVSGDTIVVSGEVRELLSGFPVSLQVFAANGNMVSLHQVTVSDDKKFSLELTAGESLMQSEGTYTIKVLYGTASRTAETTFEFIPVSGESIVVNYIDFRNVWDFEDTIQKLARDGIFIDDLDDPEKIESYFSSANILVKRVQEILSAGQYEIKNISTYENKELILTKEITININDSIEYNKIFDNNLFDNDPSLFRVQFPGNIIDENLIDQHITSALKSCQQNPTLAFCNENVQSLKKLIFNNIGTHVVTESLVLIQNPTDKKDSNIQKSFISSLIETKSNNNVSPTSDHSLPDLPPTKIDARNSLIPPAFAESSRDLRYLNGFTKGFGYGKTWTYDYKPLGLQVFFVKAHIEAGVGIGLRIPIDITVEMQEVIPQSSSGTIYDASYQVFTKNISESEYSKLGLPWWHAFEGKEFKMYVGPAGYLEVKLFGFTVYEPSFGVPKPEGKNFTPPIGANKKETFAILGVNLCDLGFNCLPSYIGNLALSVSVGGVLSADKITIDSDSLSSSQDQRGIPFTYNGDKKNSQYPISHPGNDLENVKYYSNLDFIPKLGIELSSPYIPFTLIDETLELPGIKFTNIVLGGHDDTAKKYVIPEFGTITIMMLGIAITIIIAVMARSRVVTRLDPL